jgi:hypothetical protein
LWNNLGNMNKNFIDQLFAFLGTPSALIGVASGVMLVVKASRDRPTGWLLFSMFCFASSLNTYTDFWHRIAPPLIFPLQQIRASGRPLAIILLILLVFLSLQTSNNWRRQILPPSIKYLMFVQFVVFAKTILYGSQEFALISAITFSGIIIVLKMGPGRWLQDDDNFSLAVRSIAIAGLIFVVTNGCQFLINRAAITYIHSRFMGTTGNPQHAGILLAAVVPCLMFFIQGSSGRKFAKYFWIAILLVTMYFLLLSGSRTALIMGVVSVLLFYRNDRGSWVKIVLVLAISAAILMPFLQPENLTQASTGIDTSVSDRFSSTNNTRSGVWSGMLDTFSQNILFGAPLERGRMGYGENSWLAAGATMGLLGFIPMALMGWESLKLVWRLNQLGNRDAYYFFQSSVVIAGLGSMLIGSFFEAFLLGNMTFSMIVFLTYLLMGSYLLEVDRVRTQYARAEAEFAEQSGVYQ